MERSEQELKIDSKTGLISFAIALVATSILGIVLVWASLLSVSQQPGVWGSFISSSSNLLIIALILGIASSGIVLTRVYVDRRQNRRFQANMTERSRHVDQPSNPTILA
jgi:hypothetical protein